MGWGLLKLVVIMIVCSDIKVSYILSFRCDAGRDLLQQSITSLFVLKFLFVVPNTFLFTISPVQLRSTLYTVTCVYYPSLYYTILQYPLCLLY